MYPSGRLAATSGEMRCGENKGASASVDFEAIFVRKYSRRLLGELSADGKRLG